MPKTDSKTTAPLYHAVIPLQPVTKKNSMQIVKNGKTGRPFLVQSAQYKKYAKNASWFLPGSPMISVPVNVEMKFYMKDRHRVDLSNLQSAALDVLVDCGILEDDNANIIRAHDGSRVYYIPDLEDGGEPRTEITITEYEEAI